MIGIVLKKHIRSQKEAFNQSWPLYYVFHQVLQPFSSLLEIIHMLPEVRPLVTLNYYLNNSDPIKKSVLFNPDDPKSCFLH